MDSADEHQNLEKIDAKVEIILFRYKSLLQYLKNLKCLFCKGIGTVMVCGDCGRATNGELASCRCNDNMNGVREAKCGRCYGSGKDPRGSVKFN